MYCIFVLKHTKTGKAGPKTGKAVNVEGRTAINVLLALTIFQALIVLQALTVLHALLW